MANKETKLKKSTYLVHVTIYNTYEIEACSAEDATNTVSNLSNEKILRGCDFNVMDTEELTTQ